jgi:hypothetical protein
MTELTMQNGHKTADSSAVKRKANENSDIVIVSDDEGLENGETAANYQAKRMKKVVVISDNTTDVYSKNWKDYVGQPNDNSRGVKLLLRLENGIKDQICVFSTTKLKALFVYIAACTLDPKHHVLVLSFPKRIFSIRDKELTLEEAGFSAQEVVHVERI